jgi:hypothetical protein
MKPSQSNTKERRADVRVDVEAEPIEIVNASCIR